jgi:hypothetical protein
LTLSSTDVSKADKQWVCEPLTVEDVLTSGEQLVYHVGRAIYWLEQEAGLIP